VSIDLEAADFNDDSEYISLVRIGGQQVGSTYPVGGKGCSCTAINIIDNWAVPSSVASAAQSTGQLAVRLEASSEESREECLCSGSGDIRTVISGMGRMGVIIR
jgi:hypothetical protein